MENQYDLQVFLLLTDGPSRSSSRTWASRLITPMWSGYSFSSFWCSVRSDRFRYSFSAPSPSWRMQLTAVALLSSPFLKYRDTRLPFDGIRYIRFPVSGLHRKGYSFPWFWSGWSWSMSSFRRSVSSSLDSTVPRRDRPESFSLLRHFCYVQPLSTQTYVNSRCLLCMCISLVKTGQIQTMNFIFLALMIVFSWLACILLKCIE